MSGLPGVWGRGLRGLRDPQEQRFPCLLDEEMDRDYGCSEIQSCSLFFYLLNSDFGNHQALIWKIPLPFASISCRDKSTVNWKINSVLDGWIRADKVSEFDRTWQAVELISEHFAIDASAFDSQAARYFFPRVTKNHKLEKLWRNRRIKSVLYTNLVAIILPEDLSLLCQHIPVSEATQLKLLQTETQTNKSIFTAEIKHKGN